MSDFTIGEPTEVPRRGGGKYEAIWTAVSNLGNGLALPVQLPSQELATQFVNNVSGRKGFKFQRRGATVYVSKKEVPE